MRYPDNVDPQLMCPVLHVTADNIDKQTDTLDGKNSFHATQMVVFQRGGASLDRILDRLTVTQKLSLHVPDILTKIFEPNVPPQVEPVLQRSADLKWYGGNEKSDCVVNAEAKDLAFLFGRQFESDACKIGWTEHNKYMTTKNPAITSYAFMPLILNPAHEYDTLFAVLQRCVCLADKLNYPYIDLVVDQALYCKLLELRWSSEIFQKRIILRMGGPHISMNFMGAIGHHMKSCGLSEIWTESGVLGPGSVAKVFEGKAYSKGMRVHKLTYQALWSILMPRLLKYLEDNKSSSELLRNVTQNYSDAIDFFSLKESSEMVTEFLAQESEMDPNTKFWIMYLNMVSTLLKFTRAIRDAEWDLYLEALNEMLPVIAWYDHYKYLSSLTAYIYDMNNLPPAVMNAFRSGEFVAKRSSAKFNQVDLDHAQEWLVKTCKVSGGISGITNKEATLQKWILSFHWRTEIVQKTLSLFDMQPVVGGMSKGRIKRDQDDERSILNMFRELHVLSDENRSNVLQNLVTKDVATAEIQKSLLNVIEAGRKQVNHFVTGRMTFSGNDKPAVSFVQKISKNMPLTFANLHKSTKAKPIQKRLAQNEIHLLQRLVMAHGV